MFVLNIYVPVNNISDMLGQFPVFLPCLVEQELNREVCLVEGPFGVSWTGTLQSEV